MPKLSIITPMFNSEKTIHPYFLSILNQTYTDIEIVCVDDASTDETSRCLKEYCRNDSRIKVIHNDKNIGPGKSRNIGLKHCSGDYIQFMDADDIYPNFNTVSDIVNSIDANGRPNIICGQIMFRNKYTTKITHVISSEVFNTSSFNTEHLANEIQGVWYFQRYVFKRDFLIENNLTFSDTRTCEDVDFLIDSLTSSRTISCVNIPIYVYTISTNFIERDVQSVDSLITYLTHVNKVLNRLKGLQWYRAINFLILNLEQQKTEYSEFYTRLLQCSPEANELMNKITSFRELCNNDIQKQSNCFQKQICTYIQYYQQYEKFVFYTIFKLIKQKTKSIVVLVSKDDFKYVSGKLMIFSRILGFTGKLKCKIMDDLYPFQNFNKTGRIFNGTALYRLFIPFLDEFSMYDYSIYIDSDTYICNSYNEEQCVQSILDSDFLIAGRKSVSERFMNPKDMWLVNEYIEYLNSLGKLVFGESYQTIVDEPINSGVMVFNNKKFDVDKYRSILYFILQKMQDIYETNIHSEWFKYPDQDVLNIMNCGFYSLDCAYNWKQWWYKKLSLDYNPTIVTSKLLDQISDEYGSHIIHFQGNQKGCIKPALSHAIDTDIEFGKIWERL